MHAEILKKSQESKWNKFAYGHPYTSIHQTSTWAHFQSNVPARDKFWIIALKDKNSKDKDEIIGGTLLIKHSLPKGKYCWLYSPRGPLLSYSDPKTAKQQLKTLLKEIKKIAKEENAVFYRMDPSVTRQRGRRRIKFPGFKPSHLGFQPEDTLIIDLSQTQEKILEQMKSKGRYNIRLAEKKGVKIVEVVTPTLKAKKETIDLIREFQNQIEAYFNILQETLERDKFYGHGLSFYKNMIEKLAPQTLNPNPKNSKTALKDGFAKLYLAKYKSPETRKEKYIAGVIITFYKDTAIYYYGASSDEDRNAMAPYLLQWHAIKEAKSLGCKYYDFLGIAPPKTKDILGPKKHPWRGVTGFKRKFGGEHVGYIPAQEYSFKPVLHLLYRLAKKLKKLFR